MTSVIEYGIFFLSSGGKTDVDEALVSMVIEDSQPFTIVKNKGFRKLVRALNPTHVFPTRQVRM